MRLRAKSILASIYVPGGLQWELELFENTVLYYRCRTPLETTGLLAADDRQNFRAIRV